MALVRHILSLVPFVCLVYPASYTLDTYKKERLSIQTAPNFSTSGHGSAPEFDRAGHWYGRGFNAGNSKDLEFLIDTGSTDCLIRSHYYHKGASGKYTGKNFTIVYYPDPQKNTITGKVYNDRLSFANLSFPRQDIGVYPSEDTGSQGGIIGFAGPSSSSFDSPCWFNNLCKGGYLDQCRFGLAYGTNKIGKQIIGSVDHTLFTESLTVAPRIKHPGQHWGVMGDVVIAGRVIDSDAILLTDSGTDRIFGPLAKVRPIFDLLGYSYTYHAGNSSDPIHQPSYLKAVFPCDTTLKLGFSVPSAKAYSMGGDNISKPRTFEIGQSYFGPPSPDGNCTSILWGSNQFSEGAKFGKNGWLLGQAFLEGHYVDHNLAENTMGFANLVN